MSKRFSFGLKTSTFRRALFPALLLAATIVSVEASPRMHGFTVQWGVLVPVHDYLYLGDTLPECTDAEANMMAYGHNHTLKICTGGKNGRGWQPLMVE